MASSSISHGMLMELTGNELIYARTLIKEPGSIDLRPLASAMVARGLSPEAAVKPKRIMILDEPDSSEPMSVGKIKEFTGGELIRTSLALDQYAKIQEADRLVKEGKLKVSSWPPVTL